MRADPTGDDSQPRPPNRGASSAGTSQQQAAGQQQASSQQQTGGQQADPFDEIARAVRTGYEVAQDLMNPMRNGILGRPTLRGGADQSQGPQNTATTSGNQGNVAAAPMDSLLDAMMSFARSGFRAFEKVAESVAGRSLSGNVVETGGTGDTGVLEITVQHPQAGQPAASGSGYVWVECGPVGVDALNLRIIPPQHGNNQLSTSDNIELSENGFRLVAGEKKSVKVTVKNIGADFQTGKYTGLLLADPWSDTRVDLLVTVT
jgi:hypothetical protein